MKPWGIRTFNGYGTASCKSNPTIILMTISIADAKSTVKIDSSTLRRRTIAFKIPAEYAPLRSPS
jgi:hypothetical protein